MIHSKKSLYKLNFELIKNLVLVFIVLILIYKIEHNTKSKRVINKQFIKLKFNDCVYHIVKICLLLSILIYFLNNTSLSTHFSLIQIAIISLFLILLIGPWIALCLSTIKFYSAKTICQTAYTIGYLFCPQEKYPNYIFKDTTFVCCSECYGAVIGVTIIFILRQIYRVQHFQLIGLIMLIIGLIIWFLIEKKSNFKNNIKTHILLLFIGISVGIGLSLAII